MSSDPIPSDDMAIDLGGIGRALWRAKLWMVPLLGLVAAGSFVGLSALPPKYKADAKILIEARSTGISASTRDPEADRTLLDQEGVTSQVQLINSRDLGRRVVAAEKLAEIAEFNKQPGRLARLLPFLFPVSRAAPEDKLLEAYFERLSVYPIERSRVITVEYSASDPDIAARVANAVVREYLAGQATSKITRTSDTGKWLETEIEGLRGKLAEAEAKVEAWRASHNLFSTTRDGSLVDQQLAGLSQQLTAARNDKATAEARVAQLRQMLNAGTVTETANDLLASPTYQRLRDREAGLRGRAAELSATLLPAHPQMKAIQAQIADIQTQVRGEARRILSALENDVRVSATKIADLTRSLETVKAEASRANEDDIQLRALEREAKSQRDLLESFLARYREATARQSDSAQPPDARAISEASPPSLPYFPKVLPLTGLITLASFMIISTFIVLRELLSGRAMRPVGAGARAPVAVASVAKQPDPEPDPPSPGARLRSGPRGVVTRIGGAGPVAGQTGTVSVTGTKGEAVRQAALAVARDAAATGRVCLVELAPSEGVLVPVAGFSELVAGSIAFTEALHHDPGSAIHVVPYGGTALDDRAMGTARVAIILDALASSYDHLILAMGPWRGDAPHWLSRLAAVDRILVAHQGADAEAADDILQALVEAGHEIGEAVDASAPRAGDAASAA